MTLLETELHTLILLYGYWVVGGIIGLESMGLPLPGETTLVAAAVYAGSTHRLDIGMLILAAASGAIIGDALGFWIGRSIGFPLALRHGHRINLNADRLKLGQYLFLRHGAKVVFFGRFVAFLRVLAAFLAGANRMAFPKFLVFNASGGIAWSVLVGGGAYLLGEQFADYFALAGLAALGLVIALSVHTFLLVRKHEPRLQAEADEALGLAFASGDPLAAPATPPGR